MKSSHSDLRQWCMTGALLISAAATGAQAEETGVIRIAKPRSAPVSSHIVQTSFDDLADDATDGVGAVYDSVYGATQQSHSNTRAHFASFNGQVPISQVSHHGYACDDCQMGYSDCDCPSCRGKGRFGKHGWGHHGHGGCPHCGHGCHGGHHGMLYYFKSKFGFLTPTGNGGAGSPHIGKYKRVYPQDVYHFDQRDGQLYSAPGYGAPMAVPLAPTVGHTYNYSWGVPASRLTPISNVAPRY